MKGERHHRGLRGDLHASVADGAAFSLMVGAGETYLPAFALAIGLGEVFAGLTATVPMLTGAIVQTAAPRLLARVGSYRRWVILCASLQALSFTPLVLIAVAGRTNWPTILLIATAYWACGMAASPAWNSWMAQAVPRIIRARFFAARTRASHAAVLLGLLVGGAVLHIGAAHNDALLSFATLFAIAGACRMVSVVFLCRHREPSVPTIAEQRVAPWQVVRRMGGDEGRLLLYMFVMQTATYLAAPYFTPFMLAQLKLGYVEYVLLLSASFVAKSIALPSLGRIAHRFGARALLWFGGTAVVPMAAIWIITDALPYLFMAQLVGGIAWASYELATFLLMFETIQDRERTSVLATFNLLNALAIVVGSLLGGAVLRAFGADYAAYLVLFLLSSCARLITVPMLRTLADVPRVPVWIGFRTLAVRPTAGSIERPILAAIPEADQTEPTPKSSRQPK